MKLYESDGRKILEKWACGFQPAGIFLCSLGTGEEIQETSLVAARVKPAEEDAPDGEAPFQAEQYLAAGRAALSYENTPGVMVFSPFRQGQVASYDGAVYLFREFLRRLRPGLWKPVLCIRMQEQTTEVERIALIDAGMQAGARKVFLYREPLSALREHASQRGELRRALAFHFETCEK